MRYLVVMALGAALAALTACGSSAPHESRAGAAAHRGRQLVFFQRTGGLAATLDTVTVRADGRAHMEKRYGGAGGRFKDFRLTTPLLRRVRAGLARVPARAPRDVEAGRRGGATYLLRYGGRSYAAHEGAVPHALRPVVAALDDVLDGVGHGGVAHEVVQTPS